MARLTPLILPGWLLLLTLATFAAAALAWRRIRRPVAPGGAATHGVPSLQFALQTAVLIGTAAALVWRWRHLAGEWRPISAHVDGLLLLAVAASASILFIQVRAGLYGVAAFALPLLGVILTWAICAAAWSYQPFNPDSHGRAWLTLHLTSIYLGALGALLAAGAGLAYLDTAKRLKTGRGVARIPALGSLESLERWVVVGSAIGFCLLTIGLASGIAVAAEDQTDAPWWREPKVVLGFVVWGGYGVVMNARATSRLRGTTAAVAAVVGFGVLIGAYAAAEAWPWGGAQETNARTQAEALPLAEPNPEAAP
ncbi:MAG: cytochrome c biogenesis protein CcsA [Planctomycetota bacterium]